MRGRSSLTVGDRDIADEWDVHVPFDVPARITSPDPAHRRPARRRWAPRGTVPMGPCPPLGPKSGDRVQDDHAGQDAL